MRSSAVSAAESETEVVWREVWAQTLRLGDLGYCLRLCVRCCLVLCLGFSAATRSERWDTGLGRRDEGDAGAYIGLRVLASSLGSAIGMYRPD